MHKPMICAVIQLNAPAKLTLTLRITGVRDDGFHLIDAEMVTLDFGDTLEIAPLDATAPSVIRLDWSDNADAAGANLSVPLGPDNLVARALTLAGRSADVNIIKRIPPGAGLGGGSADAAAVLRWAGFDDLDRAGQLGADIPFCMMGGRARVTGIGEMVESLDFVKTKLTLVTPPFGCSTPAVYRTWDNMGGPTGHNGNDLESAALRLEPRMAEWRDRLGNTTGEQPRMAGSGSTWFVPGHHEEAAASIPGARCVTTVP